MSDRPADVIDHLGMVVRYIPPLYGFAGMLIAGTWAYIGVSTGWLFATALTNSGMLAVLGLHAVAMGWYDDQ